MRGVALSCRYQLPQHFGPNTSERDLVNFFDKAISRVILKHAHLHIGLIGQNTNRPRWILLDSLNLADHIQWCTIKGNSVDFEKECLSRHRQLLDAKFTNPSTTPGWKIQVLRPEGARFVEVLFVFNHTNLDGISALIFHRDLLQSLRDNLQADGNGLENRVLKLPPGSAGRLCPPPENLTGFPVDPRVMRKFLQDEARMRSAGYPKQPAQANWTPITAAPFKTQFRSITISSQLVSELVTICRHHGTTLTGLFHGIALVSLAFLLEPSTASAFTSQTAMDLRRFLPSRHPLYPWYEPSIAISNYVTMLSHAFGEDLVAQIRALSPPEGAVEKLPTGALLDLVWTSACKVRRDIKDKLQMGTRNDMVGFAQGVEDWRAQLKEEARKPRSVSWVVSNLGPIDGSPKRRSSAEPANGTGWAITGAKFVLCANVVAAALNISVVSVRDGDLAVTCSWQDCVIDSELADEFVTELEKWLKYIPVSAQRSNAESKPI
ncbi:hypothetical protein ONZ43_g845 [Nemania bipapillata]|uniref:Uncharacterized protein n=1 Tax=Nemania bipapillata TaxID=110536 RepID=A0ACC2J6N0_9PEZI|nr:hypothetical protein ONZ43_g845 [Nemania bipapillata]